MLNFEIFEIRLCLVATSSKSLGESAFFLEQKLRPDCGACTTVKSFSRGREVMCTRFII